MSTLSDRLREHNDERLYREADVLMSEAADELDRLTERVAELEKRLREMVDLCELCDINETMEPDGYGWKDAYLSALSALEHKHD